MLLTKLTFFRIRRFNNLDIALAPGLDIVVFRESKFLFR